MLLHAPPSVELRIDTIVAMKEATVSNTNSSINRVVIVSGRIWISKYGAWWFLQPQIATMGGKNKASIDVYRGHARASDSQSG